MKTEIEGQASGTVNDSNALCACTLNLPTFAGEYDRWLLFRDTFKALIDSND